jgi:hypothetical protein
MRCFPDGRLQQSVKVQAQQVGSGYNLAPGYYAILPEPVTGIVQVVNTDGWMSAPGADPEPDEQLRLRTRNQFSAVNQWHTDAVYRAMIAAFPGVRPDGVYFRHDAPRPGQCQRLCCSTPTCRPSRTCSKSMPMCATKATTATATTSW